jgi:hypothetical protein
MAIKKKIKPVVKIDGGFETKEQAAALGYIAATIERVKDHQLLTLNSDLVTYSFAFGTSPNLDGHSNNKYTYERLMDDHRCTGHFRVLAWVKDFNAEKFIKILKKS